MESGRLELLCQIAKGIAAQFGSHCEVVVHDLTRHADHTIVAIENGHVSGQSAEPEKIININDVLDELIGQSVALVGKPAALMNKEDKIRAIRFLSEQGAFLVTRSGEKVAKYFGISKYTLYSYLDRSAGGQSTQDS